MLFRRFAIAIAFIVAALASQVPEFVQQYRQRLGGAAEELRGVLAQFDSDASTQALTRDQAVARLASNSDPLAQQRGVAIDKSAERVDRLERQRAAFATAGPLSQYAVFAEDFDPGLARGTLGDYQPALPATAGGFVIAVFGFILGWLVTHVLARPFRRRRPADIPATAHGR